MLTDERREKILTLVSQRGTVSVSELVTYLEASESTIRRDLSALDQRGKLKKVHGGAKSLTTGFFLEEEDVSTKNRMHVEEKKAIAMYAATLVESSDFVYIDAGTTTELLIDYLTCKDAIYMTNGITHAKKLSKEGFQIYMLPGLLKGSTEAVIGARCMEHLQSYRFTKAFMGSNGIHPDYGFTTADVEEGMVKKEAILRASESYILADHSKFDKYTAFQFAPLGRCSIITDAVSNKEYTKKTKVKEVGSV